MATPIIFDCDTGVDDALAILYGAHHGAQFVASTVTHGNVPVHVGTRNTLAVLEAVGLDCVPVHPGAALPLVQPLRTAEHVHGTNGLGNTNPPPPRRQAEGTPAAAELVRLAAKQPRELTLVAVGPLTNLALALRLDEDFAANIARVVVMGGAIGVPGNVNAVAEANTYCDPEAAQMVLEAEWDLTWVGLEATGRTALSAEHLARLARTTTRAGQLLWQAMQFYMDLYEQALGERTCLLHDPLAMALALDPELATYRYARARVELRGEHTRGQVVADLRPAAAVSPSKARESGVISFVDALDVAEFHRRFLASFEAD